MGTITSALLLSIFMTSSITLETDKGLDIFSKTKKMVAANGDILVMTPFELYHWNDTGKLIRKYSKSGRGSAPMFLSTFHYDVRRKITWLIFIEDPHSCFFDENGDMMGNGYMEGPSGEAKPAYFRDLLSAGNRIFALQFQSSAWGQTQDHIIQQVDFEKTNRGMKIELFGKAFGRFSDLQIEYQFDFKRHWLVQNGLTKKFSLVNQLDNGVQLFQPPQGQSIETGLVSAGDPMRIYLPNWTPPPTMKRNQVTPSPDEHNTFSQITGAYPWDDQTMVVGFTIPNPKGPTFGVQKIRFNGTVDGKSLTTSGYFLGAHNGEIYAIRESEENGVQKYWVDKLTW